MEQNCKRRRHRSRSWRRGNGVVGYKAGNTVVGAINILVKGHTDNTGEEDYNKELSEKRAGSVADYAKGLGVEHSRFSTVGYGGKSALN